MSVIKSKLKFVIVFLFVSQLGFGQGLFANKDKNSGGGGGDLENIDCVFLYLSPDLQFDNEGVAIFPCDLYIGFDNEYHPISDFHLEPVYIEKDDRFILEGYQVRICFPMIDCYHGMSSYYLDQTYGLYCLSDNNFILANQCEPSDFVGIVHDNISNSEICDLEENVILHGPCHTTFGQSGGFDDEGSIENRSLSETQIFYTVYSTSGQVVLRGQEYGEAQIINSIKKSEIPSGILFIHMQSKNVSEIVKLMK